MLSNGPNVDIAPHHEYWRRKPLLVRGALSPTHVRGLAHAAQDFCSGDVVSRVFVQPSAKGVGSSRLVPQPEEAWRIFQEFKEEAPLTLLANHVDRACPDLVRLRNSFGIPYGWREDDIVCSFSSAKGGIGYHAGAEDGFIVQIAGKRRWRVWDTSLVSRKYKHFLLGKDDAPPTAVGRPRSTPIVDCVLEPGDALYTPALFAHEGETLEESISISVAWRGVSYYHLFLAVGVPYTRLINLEDLFELLPDIDSRTRENVQKTTRVFLESKQSSVGTALAAAEVKAAQRMWHRLVSGGQQQIAANAAPQPHSGL